MKKELEELLALFLPDGLLEHFDIELVAEPGEVSHKRMVYEVHLREKNILPPSYKTGDHESKGFFPAKRIQELFIW